MRAIQTILVLFLLGFGSAAGAVVKLYDSSANNGSAGDAFLNSTTLCPPSVTTPGIVFGSVELDDAGLGTITVNSLTIVGGQLVDLGPEQLVTIFGPGAFIFIDTKDTVDVTSVPFTSNTSGIGAHGPSGTGANQSAEWGVVSGFEITGRVFCLSSPVDICFDAEFAHGATIPRILPSMTYDLGTWNFDAVGDYEATQSYISRTSNGGLTNNGSLLRGALHGASLPALPLLGFGCLAVSLAVVGMRSLRRGN